MSGTEPFARPSRATRRWRPLLFLVLLAVVQFAGFPGQWLGAEGDDMNYVLLSRSAARGSYTLGIAPGDAVYTQFTPGLPALLAPAARLSGDSPLGYQLTAFLWLVACDVLCFLWLRRRAGTRGALALTALFGLNPLVLSRAGVVMPELPGLAAALGVAWLVDRPEPAPAAAVGALLGLAYLIRPGMLPLVPAAGAALWRRGRRRDACAAVAAETLTWGAWRLWTRLHGGFSDTSEGLGAVAAAGWRLWPAAMLRNAAAIPTLWGRTLTPTGASDFQAWVFGAGLAFLAAWGLAGRLRRLEAWSLFLVGLLALHVAWPWWYERYLICMLPFAAFAAWEGARRLGLRRRPLALAAAAAALSPLPVQGRAVMARARDATPPWTDTYAWMRTSLPPDGLVASVAYASDSWYSGRPVVPLPRDAAGAQPTALARGRVRWVLWTPLPDYGSSFGAAFEPARQLAAWPARLAGPGFRLLKRFPDGAEVYEVRP